MKASNYFWSAIVLMVLAIVSIIVGQDQVAGWLVAAGVVCFLYDDRTRHDQFIDKRNSVRTTEELEETFGPMPGRGGGNDGWRGAGEGMW